MSTKSTKTNETRLAISSRQVKKTGGFLNKDETPSDQIAKLSYQHSISCGAPQIFLSEIHLSEIQEQRSIKPRITRIRADKIQTGRQEPRRMVGMRKAD